MVTMEKDKKINKLHSGLALFLPAFPHLARKYIEVNHTQLTLINISTER